VIGIRLNYNSKLLMGYFMLILLLVDGILIQLTLLKLIIPLLLNIQF